MIISYKEFYELLEKHIQSGEDFYMSLLKNVIDKPSRYCGLFRLSNAKTKLLQNITQSREIKFGDIFEELTTEYISRLGYTNLKKHIGKNKNDEDLNVDQLFYDKKSLYLVEMKIRDDHDSTKKRGQFQNFIKKIEHIKTIYSGKHINASMWFVDNSLIKNKNYYLEEINKLNLEEINKLNLEDVSLNLYYGEEFFNSLENGKTAWLEILDLLKEYRKLHSNNDDIQIPDFGTSNEIYQCLLKLPKKYWNKLNSDKYEYKLLREELFSQGDNLKKASENRK